MINAYFIIETNNKKQMTDIAVDQSLDIKNGLYVSDYSNGTLKAYKSVYFYIKV